MCVFNNVSKRSNFCFWKRITADVRLRTCKKMSNQSVCTCLTHHGIIMQERRPSGADSCSGNSSDVGSGVCVHAHVCFWVCEHVINFAKETDCSWPNYACLKSIFHTKFFLLLFYFFYYSTENHDWYDDRSARTVHLALIRKDDLPAAARRVDGQSLLEALLDVRAPHALRIILQGFVQRIPQLLTPTPGGGSRHPLRRRGEATERGPQSSGL